jgi:murein DD-endopeptidase MepM/ murein hydrolase activator NlpD
MESNWIRTTVLLALLLALVPLSPGVVRADGPFCIPTTGTVTNRFAPGGHGGVDIASGQSAGVTPVYAAYAGRVVYRGTMNCSTSVCYPLDVAVAINHGDINGNGTYVLSHYHHMGHGSTSYVTVNVGDWVEQGNLIGYQGDYPEPTTSGVHLHFAVAEMDRPFLDEYTSWGIRCERSDLWYEFGGADCPVPNPNPAVGVNPESGTYLGSLPGYVTETCSDTVNQSPNPPPLENPNDGDWISSRSMTLSWRDGGDPDNKPNSFRDYNVVVWDNSGWRAEQGWPVGVFYTATSWELTVPRDGTYYWHVRAGDGDLASNWSETRSFGVDTTSPTNPTAADSSCDAQNGVWQNTCDDPNFTWSGATDATSGVAGYQVYWGADPNGTTTFWTTSPGHNPPAVSTGTYYLRVRTKDRVGNWSNWKTLYTFRYDDLAPSGSFSFSGGELSHNINTLLNLDGTDIGSGVSKVRLSNNGTDWTDKEYAQQVHWTIPATDGQWHTVYLRFVDAAGNVSPVYQQQVCLDLTPPMPSSASYRLWPAGQIAGGGYASAGYRLHHTEGQPFARNPQTGSHYRLHSGFQATWPSSPGAELFTADGCASPPSGGIKVYLPIVIKNQQ